MMPCADAYTRAMFAPRSIKHCRACGGEVRYQTPADDNRDRATCLVCTTIHYENPLNVVGTLPVWEDKVLLCRRNIEPRQGLWTLPAGFMELGETTAEGALRETVEEAGARVEMQGLYSLINVVRVGQVHLFYRARLLDTDFAPGPGDDRGGPVRRSRDALGRDRLPDDEDDARVLLRGPARRPLRPAPRRRRLSSAGFGVHTLAVC